MTTTSNLRRAFAVLAIVATAAACGGDDEGGDGGDAADSPLGQALSAELLSEEDSPIETQEQADCVAGGIVSGVGEDRLAELGVTADNVGDGEIEDLAFTEEEAGSVVDALFDCVDVREALAAEFATDFGEEGGSCVAENLDEQLLRDLMTSAFLGGEDEEMPDEFFQAFLDIAAECDLPLG